MCHALGRRVWRWGSRSVSAVEGDQIEGECSRVPILSRDHNRRRQHGSRMCSAAWTRVIHMCVCVRIHLQVRIPMWVNQETHEHTIHAFEHTDHVCVLQPGHALSMCVCTYTPAGTYSYVGKPGNTRTHHRRIRTYGSRMWSAAWTRVIHMCVCVHIHLQVRIPMWVNQETHEHTIDALEHCTCTQNSSYHCKTDQSILQHHR